MYCQGCVGEVGGRQSCLILCRWKESREGQRVCREGLTTGRNRFEGILLKKEKRTGIL